MPLLSLLRRKTGGVGVYKEGVKKVSFVYSAFGSGLIGVKVLSLTHVSEGY